MADDPLDGQEVQMLNTMLAEVWKQAKAGDLDNIDRAIKILTLKRRYKEDRDRAAEEWKV
jgi:hypothetical protein